MTVELEESNGYKSDTQRLPQIGKILKSHGQGYIRKADLFPQSFSTIAPSSSEKEDEKKTTWLFGKKSYGFDGDLKPAFVIISGRVYDVREFVPAHPGGDVILTHTNGEDATDVFHAFHPESAHDTLANYYIGDLHPDDLKEQSTNNAHSQLMSEFAQEIDNLRLQIKNEGLFESSKLFYLYKSLMNFAILGLALYTLASNPRSMLHLIGSAALTGLWWQQGGWMAHDCCHHQIFKDRFWNDMFGYFWGNFVIGFSVGWWKNKHNSHHAAPNIHGVDPDIDTMPIIGWSEFAIEDFGKLPQNATTKFLIFNQAFLYFVILTMARLSWCYQSILYSLRSDIPNRWIEMASLALHWASYLGFLFNYLSPIRVLLYVVLSQAVSGFLLALVFSLNHNGMAIFSQDEALSMQFYEKQILTGRDVHPSLFSDWFTGGLNNQIEHHLFPTLPRHNLGKITPRVKALCKKYGVPYHVTGIIDGTIEVLQKLHEIGHAAKQQDATLTAHQN